MTAFTSCQVGGVHLHQPAEGIVNAFVGQMRKRQAIDADAIYRRVCGIVNGRI